MDRIQQNQPAVLTATWERDGEQVDPGEPVVVTITGVDGTSILQAVPTDGSPGVSRSISLTPAQTSTLNSWTLVWTAPDGSELTTYAEVVGDFLFTINRMRQRTPLQDTNMYPDETLLYYRTLAEMALEDACGVAFVPRYSYEEAFIAMYGVLSTSRRRINNVRMIWTSTDIGPQPLPTLKGLRIMTGTHIFMPTLWNWWSRPIFVGYEHGYPFPPPRVSRAAIELARRWVVESPWDERMTGFRTRDGGQLDILTASKSDPFDIPEVAAVSDFYGTPMVA